MTVPIPEKTWQYSVNNLVGSYTSTDAACKSAMFRLKSALIGFASNPWAVWGSNDGAGNFGNGDAVDRWAATPQVKWAATGSNHSWIVLTQTGLSAKASLLIDLNNVTTANATIVFSPSAGFGLTNGGTDGTATDRPTAADQTVLINGNPWGFTASATYGRSHVMQSTDGQCTRYISCVGNTVTGFWIFDVPKNPVSSWTNPIFFAAKQATGAMTMSTWFGTDVGYGRIDNRQCVLRVSGEGTSTFVAGTQLTVPDDQTFEWQLGGVGLFSVAIYVRGRKGELFDLLWGSVSRQTGNTYPSGNAPTWAQFDNMVVPWNGTPCLTT
jgi:hypothetical protein